MHRSQLLPFAALALLLTAGLAAFALKAGASLRTQEELDYGEGVVLWQAANVTNWKKAFHPLENYPHVVFHYPPVYHLTARLMAAATGNLLTAGRLTSILSLAGSCLVTALLTAVCLPSGGSLAARWLGALSAGTLIFTTPVWTWACLMRVDTLAIFLSFTGLALFVLARRRPALAFLSFACFVAAIYTKQTMVAAPAACLLLAFVEKPRFSAILLAFTVSAGVGVLVMLHILTDGLFLRHIIGYNLNPFALGRLFRLWIDNASRLTAPLSVAVMFPVALFCRRSGGVPALARRVRLALGRSAFERCVVVAAVHFWFAAIMTVAAGKQGAYINYFLELDLSASLISGLFLGWLARRASFRPQGAYNLLALLVIPLFLLHSVGNIITFRDAMRTFTQPAPNHSDDVVRFLQELPGPVYSENMTILMRAGKEIPAEPAIITTLARNKRWDESSFVSRIEHGEFQAIVVDWKETSLNDRERFTESVAQAVQHRYSLSKEFGPFGVYLPK